LATLRMTDGKDFEKKTTEKKKTEEEPRLDEEGE
jgi:hypothetical protein